MTQQYDNDNRAAVWPNEKKQTDRHPDYTGSGSVAGVEYFISAWCSDGQNPKAPALKFQFTPKEQVAQAGIASTRANTGLSVQPVAGARPAAAMPDASAAAAMPFNDDIPF